MPAFTLTDLITTFRDSVEQSQREFADYLYLSDSADFQIKVSELSFSDTLEFSDKMVRQHNLVVEDTINLSYVFENQTDWIQAYDQLVISDSVVFEKYRCSSVISVGQTVTTQVNRGLAPSDAVVLTDFVTMTKSKTVGDKIYTQDCMTIVTGPVKLDTLELPTPVFGNIDAYNHKVLVRRTRRNELSVVHVPGWPDWWRIVYRFEYLCGTKPEDIKSFIETHLGLKFILETYEGEQYEGYLIDPSAPVEQPGRQNIAWSMEFIGRKL